MKSIALFLLFCLPLHAQEEGCPFNFEDAKTPFIQNEKLYTKLLPVTKDAGKSILSQKIIAKNGTEITYQEGGCSHYAYSFTFTPKKVESTPDRLYQQVEDEFKTLPLTTPKDFRVITEAFKKTNWKNIKAANGQHTFSCGEASCALKTTTKDFTISFDQSL